LAVHGNDTLRARLQHTGPNQPPVLKLCPIVHDPDLATPFKIVITHPEGGLPTLSTTWRFSDSKEGLPCGFLFDYISMQVNTGVWAFGIYVPAIFTHNEETERNPGTESLHAAVLYLVPEVVQLISN
jgi:hypothetical protein